jgi:hypothetical protein
MVVDPDELWRLAGERKHENRTFLRYLRYRSRWPKRRLVALQQELIDRVWEQIDCTQCGNCCSRMQLQVTLTDCRRLARVVGLSALEFSEQYAELHRDGHWYLRQYPCRFLDGKKCSIYESRPSTCRGFPYLDGALQDDAVADTLVGAAYCPIVFHVLEEMKAVPGLWPRRPKR